jgi:hypothetical protein
MRKTLLALAAVALTVPAGLSAQGFGIAARAGTIGLGAEAAVGLTDAFVIRGGIGLMPLEPSATISDIDFTLKLPETWFNIGADLYLGSGFRIGGGMLFKSDDPELEGELLTNVDIGGRSFTPAELGTLSGVLDSKDKAPYALIGFGKHTTAGIGLFLDLGVAFTGDPQVSLAADNGSFNDLSELRQRLDAEEREIEDDLGQYLKLWPILNLGLKIGIGG